MYGQLLLPELQEMLQQHDTLGLREFCDALHPAVIAQVIENLSNQEIWQVLDNCGLHRRVEIVEFLTMNRQLTLVREMDKDHLSALVRDMSPDNCVDLLEKMDQGEVDSLLQLLAQSQRNDIRRLLSYPDDSAGSIMTTEYASLPEGISVGEALNQLRLQAPNSETIYYVYIVDEDRRLRGFITLRSLILAKTSACVDAIMEKDVLSVRVTDDQEQVAQLMARYNFLAVPVVDQHHQLVGIITHDDVIDVLQEEATEDAQLLAAVQPMETGYLTTPLWTIAWKRGGWLLFLFCASFLSAHVLQSFQHLSKIYEWLALFVPLVIATGGNAASQTATLVIRTMALGELDKKSKYRLIQREFAIGLILGGSLTVCGFVLSLGLITPYQSLVVVGTVPLVVLTGTMIGAILPISLKSCGMDPALMSTPLIASLLDVFGIVLYFNVALALLGR
ncbi:MAG: Magnesium transporter MgtE [Planctomycetaceae bacterium]|nr:Magnesium transporter MgtE [Planctomycetaceae bacterium]